MFCIFLTSTTHERCVLCIVYIVTRLCVARLKREKKLFCSVYCDCRDCWCRFSRDPLNIEQDIERRRHHINNLYNQIVSDCDVFVAFDSMIHYNSGNNKQLGITIYCSHTSVSMVEAVRIGPAFPNDIFLYRKIEEEKLTCETHDSIARLIQFALNTEITKPSNSSNRRHHHFIVVHCMHTVYSVYTIRITHRSQCTMFQCLPSVDWSFLLNIFFLSLYPELNEFLL